MAPRILVGLNYPPRGTKLLEEGEALPLQLVAYDIHELTYRVTGQSGATLVQGERRYRLLANTRIEWQIEGSDNGEFLATESDENGSNTATGEQALYRPPSISLTHLQTPSGVFHLNHFTRRNLRDLQSARVHGRTVRGSGTRRVRVKATIIHDDSTKDPQDHREEVNIDLLIVRKAKLVMSEGPKNSRTLKAIDDPSDPERGYLVSVTGPPPIVSIPRDATPAEEVGEHSRATWRPGPSPPHVSIVTSDLESGPKEKVLLVATGNDQDRLKVECLVEGRSIANNEIDIEDYVEYSWSLTPSGGSFPAGNKGKAVILEAPESPGEYSVTLSANDFQTPRLGGRSSCAMTREIRLRVLDQGIDLTECRSGWLPTSVGFQEASNPSEVKTLEITAKIYKCENGNWQPGGRPRRIRFELESTMERGICMNFGKSLNPDLWFPGSPVHGALNTEFNLSVGLKLGYPDDCEDNNHEHCLIAITKRPMSDARVIVRSEDFGAYGKVVARAYGCKSIPPRESASAPVACPHGGCCTGDNSIAIPHDENNNHIADGTIWDSGYPDEDQDSRPHGNGVRGDDLTNYEEYRGFITLDRRAQTNELRTVIDGRIHVRTSPLKKDFFVYARNGLRLGFFHRSQLRIHEIDGTMYYSATRVAPATPPTAISDGTANWVHRDDHMVINGNRGFATRRKAYGIILENATLTNTTVGIAIERLGAPSINGPPSYKAVVRVDKNQCGGSGSLLASTIAHELGHSVNLWHHGDLGLPPAAYAGFYFRSGETSGFHDCIMRYTGFSGYVCNIGPAPAYSPTAISHTHLYPANEPDGTRFCEGTQGTAQNDPLPGTPHRNDANPNTTKPVVGPSPLGRCRHQFQVAGSASLNEPPPRL